LHHEKDPISIWQIEQAQQAELTGGLYGGDGRERLRNVILSRPGGWHTQPD
jgi:hypothetical protein